MLGPARPGSARLGSSRAGSARLGSALSPALLPPKTDPNRKVMKKVRKVCILCKRSLKKSKKHQARTPVGEGGKEVGIIKIGKVMKKVRKVCILCRRSLKKSKKHRARTPARFSRDVFSTFSYPSQLKPILLKALLEGDLPKSLSKPYDLDERGSKKSKKMHRSVIGLTN